jgi:hypothetical protein
MTQINNPSDFTLLGDINYNYALPTLLGTIATGGKKPKSDSKL